MAIKKGIYTLASGENYTKRLNRLHGHSLSETSGYKVPQIIKKVKVMVVGVGFEPTNARSGRIYSPHPLATSDALPAKCAILHKDIDVWQADTDEEFGFQDLLLR